MNYRVDTREHQSRQLAFDGRKDTKDVKEEEVAGEVTPAKVTTQKWVFKSQNKGSLHQPHAHTFNSHNRETQIPQLPNAARKVHF